MNNPNYLIPILLILSGGFFVFHNETIEESEKALPPQYLIEANMEETDLSAEVTLSSCFVKEELNPLFNFECQAKLNRVYFSKIREIPEKITYRVTIESSDKKETLSSLEGKRYLISVNKYEKEETYWSAPDVGYAFKYSPQIEEYFKSGEDKLRAIKNSFNVPPCGEEEPGTQCAQ